MTRETVGSPEGSGTIAASSSLSGISADRSRSARWVLPTIGVVTFLVLWEFATRSGAFPRAIPPGTESVAWLADAVRTGDFWAAVGDTLFQWGVGLFLSVAAGVPVGIAMGVSPVFRRLFEIPFDFLRPIPSIVYLPLVVLILGTGSDTAILVTVGGAVWPLLFNTYYGISGIDPVVQDTGRAFGLTRRQRLLYILLPSILPNVATGFRIAASMALVIVVSVGLITGVPGIGQNLQVYATNGVYPGVYALILVTGLLGLIMNNGLERVERLFLSWHPAHRRSEFE